MKSRGHVKEQFAWRHYYWYLTNQGIEYLRSYLNLPDDVVPATMKTKPAQDTRRARAAPRPDYKEGAGTSDRGDYRKAAEKKGDLGLGPNQELEFVSTQNMCKIYFEHFYSNPKMLEAVYKLVCRFLRLIAGENRTMVPLKYHGSPAVAASA